VTTEDLPRTVHDLENNPYVVEVTPWGGVRLTLRLPRGPVVAEFDANTAVSIHRAVERATGEARQILKERHNL
jgi:hypothetical protein